MNRSEIDALIQEALDGEASPEKLERLRAVLASDPAARARHQELGAVFGLLGPRGPLVDPPADLRPRVLSALPARAASTPTRERSPLRGGLFGGRMRLAIPLAAAAGAALVVAYFTWPVARLGDPDGVRGAMTPSVAARAFTDELRLGDVTARLTATRQGSRVDLRIEAGGGPGDVAIVFDPRALRPLDPGPFTVVEPGRLTLPVGGSSLDARAAFDLSGPAVSPLEVVLTTASGTQRTAVALDRLGSRP